MAPGTVGVTGAGVPTQVRRLVVPHGNCQVVVLVTENGQFAGIDEVRIPQDFRRRKQVSAGYLDVEEFYKD